MIDYRSKEIKIILVLLILTSIFFWKVVINPGKMIYPAYDMADNVEPMKLLQYQSFQKYGTLPLWNPYETGGSTFVGSILSAMYYPTNLLYFFINPDYLLGYIFALDIFLAGMFMYLLCKSIKLDNYSSILSAVVYMFSGIFISRMNIGHPQVVDIFSLMPLLFLFFIKAFERNNWKYAALAGIVLGFQILAGYPQYAIYSAYALAAYFLYDIFVGKKISSKRFARQTVLFGIVILIAFIVSAVQLLPSFELSKYAIHAGSSMSYEFITSDANSYALTPRYIVSFIFPDFFGFRLDHTYWATEQFEEVTAYIGILPLILSLLAVMFERNKYTLFFAALGIVSLFFSFGQYNPAFPYIHKIILFFDIVRNPARFLFLFVFSFSVLAGFGFGTFRKALNNSRNMLSRMTKVFFIFAVIAAIASLAIYALKDKILSIGNAQISNSLERLSAPSPDRIGTYVFDYYLKNKSVIVEKIYWYILGDSLKLFAILVSAALLLMMRIKYNIGVRFVSLALLILVVADLWLFGMKYVDVAPVDKIYPQNPAIDYVAKDAANEHFRVVGLNRTLGSRFATRNGVEIIDGFVPISLDYSAKYITAMENMKLEGANAMPVVRNISNPKMLDLLNVKYVLSTEKFGNGRYSLVSATNVTSFDIRKQLDFNQTIYLYRNDNMLPRAFVAGDYIVMNKDKMLDEMKKPDFDPWNTVLLEENPLGSNSTKGEWNATIMYYSPNKIALSVNMTQPGFLVLSEIWYPDWKAYYYKCSNGVCSDKKAESNIYKTDYILRSIYLDKGEYRVEFDYDNLSGMIR